MTVAYKRPENVTLLSDDQVTASEKFNRVAPGRMKAGSSYKIVGACHVEPRGRMTNAWDGILLEDPKGREFPVSINTLVGIGFYRADPNDEVTPPEIRRVSNQAFEDVTEVLDHKGKSVRVMKLEKLEITNFQKQNGFRDFPVLQKIG